MEILIAFIFVFAVTFYRWLLLVILWGWFVSPILGLPEISYWQMAGLSVFCSIFAYKYNGKDMDAKDIVVLSLTSAGVMSMLMGMAWLIKLGI